jgi:hypothetical protein
MYALRAPDTRRQWPRRFKYFLNSLDLSFNEKDREENKITLEEQARRFARRAKKDRQWAQDNLMRFLVFQRERFGRKEICEGTIRNYYKATKRFCVMNDTELNWKPKIHKRRVKYS